MAVGGLKFPAANQQVANRKRDTAELQLRQAVSQYQPGQNVTQAAQQTGAAATQAQGQINLQEQQANQQMAGQQAAQELQKQGQGFQRSLQQQQANNFEQSEKLKDNINRLGQEAADLELSSRLNFENYKGQQKYLTERNYADYAIQLAEDREKLADWEQASKQAHQKKMTMMDIAYRKVIQGMEQQYQSARQEDRQALKQKLGEMKRAYQERMTQMQNEAANKAAMWGAVQTVGQTALMAGVTVGTGGVAGPALMAAGGATMLGGMAGQQGMF